MKRLHIVIIAIVAAVLIIFYLSNFGIQTISTDKAVYSIGENITVQYSDFGLEWCTCGGHHLQTFKSVSNTWEKVEYGQPLFKQVCLDGKAMVKAYPCDVVSCGTPTLKSGSWTLAWNGKIYERIGTVDSCLRTFDNELVNGTFENYVYRNADAGTYRIIFGGAEHIFEIRA